MIEYSESGDPTKAASLPKRVACLVDYPGKTGRRPQSISKGHEEAARN